MTGAGIYEFSTFTFDLGSRDADAEMFASGGFDFAGGDKLLRIENAVNQSAVFDLMALDDTFDLSGLRIEVYGSGSALLASFDYGGSMNGFKVNADGGILSLSITKFTGVLLSLSSGL